MDGTTGRGDSSTFAILQGSIDVRSMIDVDCYLKLSLMIPVVDTLKGERAEGNSIGYGNVMYKRCVGYRGGY
jgi:hypothetical protein